MAVSPMAKMNILPATVRRHPVRWYLGSMYALLAFAVFVGGGGHGWMWPSQVYLILSGPAALLFYPVFKWWGLEDIDPSVLFFATIAVPVLNVGIIAAGLVAWRRLRRSRRVAARTGDELDPRRGRD